MKYTSRSPFSSQMAFWGICIVIVAWLAATVIFETRMGVPGTGIQWAKRMVGWGVEAMLVRTLILGTRKCRGGCAVR